MKNLIRKIFEKLNSKPSRIIRFQGRSKFRKLTVVDKPYGNERVLYAGNKLYVAAVDLRTGRPLYTTYFLSLLLNPMQKSLLFLGGGPNAVPAYVWRKYKPTSIDVIERDELNTEIARKYFRLPQSPGYKVIHQGASEFLQSNSKTYDLIFMNIGLTGKRGKEGGDLHYLCTLKGIAKMKRSLNRNGILMYILITKLKGRDLTFASKCLMGIRKYFREVYIFSDYKNKPAKTQLVLFMASDKKADLERNLRELSSKSLLKEPLQIFEELLKKSCKKSLFRAGINPFN